MAAALESPFVVRCAGTLTLANAPDLRVEILNALQQHDAVVFDLPDASDIDLTFVQMLVSARKSATASGKALTIHAPNGDALLSRLLSVGLQSSEIPSLGDLPTASQPAIRAASSGASPSDLDPAALATLVKEIGSAAVEASLDIFFAEMSDRIAVLRQLSSDVDQTNIRREAHSVKGTAGIFGFRRLAEEGAELERMSHALTGTSYLTMLDRLEAAYLSAREALRTSSLMAA